jgi:hypothetical protein
MSYPVWALAVKPISAMVMPQEKSNALVVSLVIVVLALRGTQKVADGCRADRGEPGDRGEQADQAEIIQDGGHPGTGLGQPGLGLPPVTQCQVRPLQRPAGARSPWRRQPAPRRRHGRSAGTAGSRPSAAAHGAPPR